MMPESVNESRILIVDDESANINLLGETLSKDYKVIAANSGEKALQLARQEKKPDLILLDVMMPDMNGFEVCQQLKADEDTADIAVIFITSLDDKFNEEAGFNAGACDYIQKPFSPSIVKARVKVHLENIRYRNLLELLLKISADEIKKLGGKLD